jgi:enoyl-[acyl-carrier protein] reductase I
MYPIDLKDKTGVVFGVANHRSIAWAIASILHEAGAKLAIAYQNERVRSSVAKLVEPWGDTLLVECDVSQDENVAAAYERIGSELGRLDVVAHSIAFANREDLGGAFMETSREGFRVALDVSAYSLIPVSRYAAPLMDPDGGSILAMTFQASERVFPGYNVMGTAKAALENEVRQLAAEYGPRNIRVNAIYAGPLETLAGRGITGFRDMRRMHAERAPLQRNITHREVGDTALFLCSDLSSGVTGAVIPVDAGYHVMAV